MRRLFVVGLCVLAAKAAMAQPLAIGDALRHQEGQDMGGKLGFFTSFDVGASSYRAIFDGDFTFKDRVGTAVDVGESFELEERDQRLTHFGPQFGLRWMLDDNLSLRAAVGASWMRLEQQPSATVPLVATGGGNELADWYTKLTKFNTNPGFSLMLGGDYVALRLQRVAVKAGLQLTYLSTSGLKGHTLEGSGQVPGNSFRYRRIETTDVSLNLFTLQPNAGLEWRPFGSFLVNSFGIYFAYTFSASSMTKESTDFTEQGGAVTTDRTTETDVGVAMRQRQMLGAYYGWYVGVPHFGNLGLEVQFGGRLVASLSYQYYF